MELVPLKTTRLLLTWLRIYPAEIYASKWQQRAHKIFCACNFAFLTLLTCTASIHFIKSLDDPEEIVFMVLEITGIVNSLYIMTTLFIRRDAVTQMLDNLVEIYETCKQF